MPADVAGQARESVVGATTAAAHLPGPVGASLLESAQSAFTGGLHVVMAITAALFAILAVVSVVTLRQVPATGEAQAAGHAAEPVPVNEPALSAA